MYNRHKVLSVSIFCLAVCLSFVIRITYKQIAEIAITVVSISLAVYIAAISTLLGSPYADRLKAVKDNKFKTKSQLGVLATYLRIAGGLSMVTIIASCLYQFADIGCTSTLLPQIVSSTLCGIFSLNLLFLWLIFNFLVTALINSALKQ